MPLQNTNCSLCGVYEPCYHVCCMAIFACRHCLMDSELLAENNECPECHRFLEAVYHNLINQARFNEGSNWSASRLFPNSRPRTPQASHSQNQFRNNFNFQSSNQEVEEEFEFAQTVHNRQSQVRRFTNDFTSHLRNNSNQYQQENYNQQSANNSFGQNKPFPNRMNTGNTPFGQRNNFVNGQFNGNRNNHFEDSGHYNENSYNPNLGFQHHNEIYNNNFNQGCGYNTGNGGFTQNIRQNKQINRNNNFQQNNFQNNFSNNDQYQNQQKVKFGPSNTSNPFPMWNQQRTNNFQQNQGNFKQNQGNFNQNQNNSFQFNNNSFQNAQSYERATKSVGKVHQLKRVNNFNGNSSSFKIDNHGNNSNSDKEHSPTFGTEFNNDQNLSGAIVPFGNQFNGVKMEIENEGHQQNQGLKKTKSHDSLMTLGPRRDDSLE